MNESEIIKKNKKIVLMIDNEPLIIDRRIILEAKTLIEAGYRVILATKSDGVKLNSTIEYGVEIERFPRIRIFDINTYQPYNPDKDAQLIISWTASPGNLQLEKQIRNKFKNSSRLWQSIVYAFICPPVFAAAIRHRFPLLKIIFRRAFEPLCYLILLRPGYLTPYFRVIRSRIKNKIKSLLQRNAQVDLFYQEIHDFAKTLKPDFVHAHDLPNLDLGVQIAKHTLIPLVYDAHELYPLQFFSSEARRGELANLERRLIINTDAVIAVNKQCQQILQKSYPEVKEIVILSNATENPINFDPEKRERLWHKRFKLNENVKIMVFQGGINPVRNVDNLLRAMVHMPDNIHIGFITYKKDVPYYHSFTATLGISHRVHYVLEIPWDEVIHWLAAADVGVMPYQAHNINAKISSPNKLFEFMVAGLPIIASSELDNVRQVIEEHRVGVCQFFREDDSYAEAIIEMFDEGKGGPDRFRKNVALVRHQFTWDHEAPKLKALYAKLSQSSQQETSPVGTQKVPEECAV